MATIADRIVEALYKNHMSQADLVNKTGIGKSSISTYISGDYEPKQRNIYKIAQALGVTPEWLMGFDTPAKESNILPLPKMNKIPLLGVIACGNPILAQENIESYIGVPEEINATFALRCKGDSMINARIYDGDIVYIREQPDVENGEIAAVLIDDEATLKRVYKSNNGIVLQPENGAYQPFVFSGTELDGIRILGKAVAFLGWI